CRPPRAAERPTPPGCPAVRFPTWSQWCLPPSRVAPGTAGRRSRGGFPRCTDPGTGRAPSPPSSCCGPSYLRGGIPDGWVLLVTGACGSRVADHVPSAHSCASECGATGGGTGDG